MNVTTKALISKLNDPQNTHENKRKKLFSALEDQLSTIMEHFKSTAAMTTLPSPHSTTPEKDQTVLTKPNSAIRQGYDSPTEL